MVSWKQNEISSSGDLKGVGACNGKKEIEKPVSAMIGSKTSSSELREGTVFLSRLGFFAAFAFLFCASLLFMSGGKTTKRG